MITSSVLALRWKSERELVTAAANGEDGALEHLVETYLPQISRAARVYRNTPGVDRSELMQDGVVGLLRALERFDVSLGTPFWPYASWWVRQAMQHLVAQMTRQVVLSDRALRRLSRIRDARASWLGSQGREPTVRELTEVCGCAREDVERLLAAEIPSRGLEEPLGRADDAAETLRERLADETSADEYDAVLDRSGVVDLRAGCDRLTDRERQIVYLHYGLSGPARTLREIAAELSLSLERVRQIEDGALEKLREQLDGDGSVLRAVDPGDSPHSQRKILTRELALEGCGGLAAQCLVVAVHELTAGVWRRGRAPQAVRVGHAGRAVLCEVSDPQAGPVSRASARLVTRLTSRIDRLGPGAVATFRLWA